jgi:outer membrane protein assembly factor BamE (lipoprotein component of BamABCDE complex)
MKTFRTILLLTAVTLLAACSKLTQDNLQKIHSGMSITDVKAILGEPTSSQQGSFLGQTGTVFVYHTDKSDVKITFINDKVAATEGSFQ